MRGHRENRPADMHSPLSLVTVGREGAPESRQKPMLNEESVWLHSVVELQDGYEADAVARFSRRLIALARARMPEQLKGRVDPEDVVQSVFRSFFTGNQAGEFVFQESSDVWRLLAAITYRKVQQTIRHHHRQRRDVAREISQEVAPSAGDSGSATASSLAMMVELIEELTQLIPERHRAVLTLRLENYSVEEIADRVGVSTRTVERALAIIREAATTLLDP